METAIATPIFGFGERNVCELDDVRKSVWQSTGDMRNATLSRESHDDVSEVWQRSPDLLKAMNLQHCSQGPYEIAVTVLESFARSPNVGSCLLVIVTGRPLRQYSIRL